MPLSRTVRHAGGRWQQLLGSTRVSPAEAIPQYVVVQGMIIFVMAISPLFIMNRTSYKGRYVN